MNPLRIRILTEIDITGESAVTLIELGEAFNHERHWRNWALKWNLDTRPGMSFDIVFTRKLRGF